MLLFCPPHELSCSSFLLFVFVFLPVTLSLFSNTFPIAHTATWAYKSHVFLTNVYILCSIRFGPLLCHSKAREIEPTESSFGSFSVDFQVPAVGRRLEFIPTHDTRPNFCLIYFSFPSSVSVYTRPISTTEYNLRASKLIHVLVSAEDAN